MERAVEVLVELEISVAIYGVQIVCVNVWEETFVHAYKCKKNGCFGYFNGSDSFAGVFWRDFGIQYLVFTCRSSVLCRNYHKRIRTKNGSCIFYRKCDFKFAFTLKNCIVLLLL